MPGGIGSPSCATGSGGLRRKPNRLTRAPAGRRPGLGIVGDMPDIEGRIAALPIWTGAVTLAPLHGGISNLSFAVTDNAGKYVVRIPRDFPFHHVFRDREVMSARAAHAAGFAPEVIHAEP